MADNSATAGLLTRAICWLLIGAAMALALGSALPRGDQMTAGSPQMGADLPLRVALGMYQLGGPETAEQTESWIGAPSTQPQQALQQALVMEVLRGPAAAEVFLATAEPELSTWLTARWQGDSDTPAPAGFAAAAGRFAPLAGGPDARHDLLVRSAMLVTGATLVSLVGVVAFVIGCVLFVLAVRRWRSGQLWSASVVFATQDWAHPTAYLVAFVVYLGSYFLYAGSVPELVEGSARLAILWGFIFLVPLPLLFARRLGARELATAIGWHRGAGVLREIGCGLVGYCAGLPVILLGVMGTSWLSAWAPASHPVAEMISGEAPLAVILILFSLAAIFAPLIEEVFFRGVLLAHLRPGLGVPAAVFIGAVVFAAVHPQGVAGLPALTAIGVVLGAIRCWRGSLIGSITAHALHNGILVLIMIAIAT